MTPSATTLPLVTLLCSVTVARGAAILRVHDVRETVDALKVWQAIEMR